MGLDEAVREIERVTLPPLRGMVARVNGSEAGSTGLSGSVAPPLTRSLRDHPPPQREEGCDTVRVAHSTTLVAGIGFRAGTEPEEIVTLLRQALATLPRATALGAIATAADRADEAPVRLAAQAFGLAPIPVESAALAAVDARVPTRSARIEASRGVGSVAEAAALAAAGEGGRLVLSRIASAGATCALAVAAARPPS